MKKVLVVLLALVMAGIAVAETFKVYEARQTIIPAYTVKGNADGTYSVYKAGQAVIPAYMVKPNPSGGYDVYKAGQAVISSDRIKSLYEVKELK